MAGSQMSSFVLVNAKKGRSRWGPRLGYVVDLKEQYLIICSEMEEGNDSPLLDKKYNKIVKELKQTILYMNKIGEMSKVQANHLIASL